MQQGVTTIATWNVIKKQVVQAEDIFPGLAGEAIDFDNVSWTGYPAVEFTDGIWHPNT